MSCEQDRLSNCPALTFTNDRIVCHFIILHQSTKIIVIADNIIELKERNLVMDMPAMRCCCLRSLIGVAFVPAHSTDKVIFWCFISFFLFFRLIC